MIPSDAMIARSQRGAAWHLLRSHQRSVCGQMLGTAYEQAAYATHSTAVCGRCWLIATRWTWDRDAAPLEAAR